MLSFFRVRPRARRILGVFAGLISLSSLAWSQSSSSDSIPAESHLLTKEQDPLLQPVAPPTKLVRGWRDALVMVRARSTDLQNALAAVERAEGAARVALASSLPILSANGNVTNVALRTITNPLTGEPTVQTFPANGTTYGGSGTLTVPLFAPRAWYAKGTADRSKDVARLSLQDQRRLLAGAVAGALVSLITAERVSDLNRVGLRTALERLELTKRRSELGSATGLDVLRVEQDAATARAQIVTGDESLRQARESLGLALGFPEAFGVAPDINLDNFVQESERTCSQSVTVEQRPDVASAMTSVDVARRSVHDVELQFFPTLNFVSSYNLSVQPFVNGIANRTVQFQNWSLGGVLAWNIFDGGIRYGNLRDTQAQVTQAAARAEALRRNATVEVTRALRGIHVADQSLEVALQTRNLAQETDRLARINFSLGRGTSLDLVDGARRLREAEIQLALRQFELVQAKIRARLAVSICE